MKNQPAAGRARPVTSIDIRKILGDLDDAKVSAIQALNPSLVDLEDAAICMAGDHDVPGQERSPCSAMAARIVELLAEEEEEPER